MMAMILQPLACLIGAYLLGSIPTSVWAGKWFFGIDVREHGSGNAGATNVYRVLGAKTAIPVMIIDVLKAVIAVNLATLVKESFQSDEVFRLFQYSLGVAAVLGHVFPIFAGFRGGKGIATLAGTGMVLFPMPMLVCLIIFAIVLAITKYVSLGSIVAALSFPIVVVLFMKEPLLSEIVFSILVAIFVPLTHRKNIIRLLKGEENKISFKKKHPQ